jgi:hypothetical protein
MGGGGGELGEHETSNFVSPTTSNSKTSQPKKKNSARNQKGASVVL